MFGCPQFDLSCQSINFFVNLKRARGGGGGGGGWRDREERSGWVEYLYYDHAQIKHISRYLTTNSNTSHFFPAKRRFSYLE